MPLSIHYEKILSHKREDAIAITKESAIIKLFSHLQPKCFINHLWISALARLVNNTIANTGPFIIWIGTNAQSIAKDITFVARIPNTP